MFGIHGIAALRAGGELEGMVRRILYRGPSTSKLPRERVLSDLRFVVESAPVCLWECDESCVVSKEHASSFELVNGGDSSPGLAWVKKSGLKSKIWLDRLATDEEGNLTKLEAFLDEQQRGKKYLTLGSYFGCLFEFWLRNCPELGVESLATSVRVTEGRTTLGSLKYVWAARNDSTDGVSDPVLQFYHLEVSVKYFAQHGNNYVGPHLSETLETRFRFAKRKLGVARVVASSVIEFMAKNVGQASKLVDDNGNTDQRDELTSFALIKGFMFYPLCSEDDMSTREAAQVNATICTNGPGHQRHIQEKSVISAGWYSRSFSRVLEQCSQTISMEDERWAVLPKLYWLSSVEIFNSEEVVQRFGLPLLNREEMTLVLQAHFSERSTKDKEDEEPIDTSTANGRRKQLRRSIFNGGNAPLKLCQLILDRGRNVWVERGRGFVLPSEWDPGELIRAEFEGDGVPNEPIELEVVNPKKVECVVGTLETKNKSKEDNGKIPTSDVHGSCELCLKFPLTGTRAPASLEALVWRLMGSLFGNRACLNFALQLEEGLKSASSSVPSSLIAGSLYGGFACNKHSQHFIAALQAEVLNRCETAPDVTRLAVEICHVIVAAQLPLSKKERKSLCRIVLRGCDRAYTALCDKKHGMNRLLIEAVKTELFRELAVMCIDDGSTEMLHPFFAITANIKPETTEAKDECIVDLGMLNIAAATRVQAYVDSLSRSFASCDESDSDELNSTMLIGLIQTFGLALPRDNAAAILRNLMAAKRFLAAEHVVANLEDKHDELKHELFRMLVVQARAHRNALRVLDRFQLEGAFPRLELDGEQPNDENSIMFEECFHWTTHRAESGNGSDSYGSDFHSTSNKKSALSVLHVNSLKSLQDARTLFHEYKESSAADGAPVVIGIDSEWGSAPLDKFSRPKQHEKEQEIKPYLALCQIALGGSGRTLLVDLETLFQFDEKSNFDSSLRTEVLDFMDEVLDGSNSTLVGFGCHEDLKRLKMMLGSVSPSQPAMHVVDAQSLLAGFVSAEDAACGIVGDPYGVSLAKWVTLLLGARMDKTYQCSDWQARPLKESQVRYAVLDAVAPLLLAQKVVDIYSPDELRKWAMPHRLSTEF